MADDFKEVFATLRAALESKRGPLVVVVDTSSRYTLNCTKPSPFPQHKDKPLSFGEVRLGKAYVSLHLVPFYMNPPLVQQIPPSLKKRMQGLACFNFKATPGPELLAEIKQLVEVAMKDWKEKDYL